MAAACRRDATLLKERPTGQKKSLEAVDGGRCPPYGDRKQRTGKAKQQH
ncbi:hypothetical protein RAS2_30600 [Phycisphaerae bacterium RAS2]|nr:hypothetical protein RAS2_30600 [Phycisphaerae bacterium RAS2]